MSKRSLKDGSQSEADFQAQIIQLAKLRGYKVYHVPDSRKCTSDGYPDLHIMGHGTSFFVELKSAKGKASDEQKEWLRGLNEADTPAFVLRPIDWDFIEIVLLDPKTKLYYYGASEINLIREGIIQ